MPLTILLGFGRHQQLESMLDHWRTYNESKSRYKRSGELVEADTSATDGLEHGRKCLAQFIGALAGIQSIEAIIESYVHDSKTIESELEPNANRTS